MRMKIQVQVQERTQTNILLQAVPALFDIANDALSTDELKDECVGAMGNIAGDCWHCKQVRTAFRHSRSEVNIWIRK